MSQCVWISDFWIFPAQVRALGICVGGLLGQPAEATRSAFLHRRIGLLIVGVNAMPRLT